MSFLDVLLGGYKKVQNNGTLLPTEPILNFIGATSIVDDPSNTRTTITVTPSNPGGYAAVHQLTHADGPTYTVAELTGALFFSISSFNAAFTFKMPPSSSSPATGMLVTVAVTDTSWSDTYTLTFNGNGYNMEYAGVSAATQVFDPDTGGSGFAITWVLNGTIWVAT